VQLNTSGANRLVLLVGPWALKVPQVRSWRAFLFGLLNNLNEAEWSQEAGHCPVLLRGPGGLFIVMPRVRTLTPEEFASLDVEALPPRPERKPDSFGWLGEQLVAVDYGW
jgi:hypothetical protein